MSSQTLPLNVKLNRMDTQIRQIPNGYKDEHRVKMNTKIMNMDNQPSTLNTLFNHVFREAIERSGNLKFWIQQQKQ